MPGMIDRSVPEVTCVLEDILSPADFDAKGLPV